MSRTKLSLASTALAATLSIATAARAEGTEAPSPAVAPLASAPAASAVTTPAASAASATPAQAATAVTPAEAPVVELSADDGRAKIERRTGTNSPTVPLLETGLVSVGIWEHACVAPCQLRLDPRYSYRVSGDGLVPSDSFTLPRGQERVRVDAKMGSSVGRAFGAAGTIGGILAIAGGGLALVSTPILESQDIGSKGFRTGVLAGGVGAVSVGVLSTAIGLYLWMSNGSLAHAEPVAARQASR